MLKTLEELNREFLFDRYLRHVHDDSLPKPVKNDEVPEEAKPPEAGEANPDKEEALAERPKKRFTRKSSGALIIISDLLFYTAILVILFSVFVSGRDGAPRTVAGYSYFTVLSSSMQNEIPKGSFILVKQTNPQDFEIGDNITYMRDRSTSVTHKIVDIYENYQNSGARGFQTQGTNNANPDKDIVYESNVVGKVVLSLPAVGAAIAALGANMYLVFIIFGLCIILSFCIRGLFARPERNEEEQEA